MSHDRRRNRTQGFSTRAIHLGYDPAEHEGALTPPIFMTSTYAFESAEQGAEICRGGRPGYVYGRSKNPTQTILEERMASLEGAEAGMTAASGMGAIASVVMTLLAPGDEVVIDHTLYGNTYALFTQGLAKLGIGARPADFTQLDVLTAQIGERTKLVFFETPANPNLRVIDIAAVSRIRPGLSWSSTIPSARRSCSARWSSEPISSFIRARNISAATATCWPGSSWAQPSC